jgi:hypothetical protein
MKSQMQLYRESEARVFDQNRHFMEMINNTENPLTNSDLTNLVKLFPQRWGRFAQFIGKLKD